VSGGVHPADPVSLAVARAFRDERATVLATLIRQAGDFQLAEDAVQDAFEAAMTAWRRDGVPAIRVRGSRPRHSGGRSTACVATVRWRIAPSGWPS
jgi:outer membrane PBP1 activator LpoA protein